MNSGERRTLALPDGAMSYLVAGSSGPLVVFCHATGFNAGTYRFLYEKLARDMRVIAPDLRGHGLSTLRAERDEDANWLTYSADLRKFLHAVLPPNEKPPVLAGHSMGGTVSLITAAHEPSLASGLVLAEPVAVDVDPAAADAESNPFVEGAKRRRAHWPDRAAMFNAYRGKGIFKSFSDAMLRDYIEGGTRDLPDGSVTLSCAPRWEAATFGSRKPDFAAALQKRIAPVRIFRAARSSMAFEKILRNADPLGVDVVTLPDTTHFLPMERADTIADAIRQMAQAARPARPARPE